MNLLMLLVCVLFALPHTAVGMSTRIEVKEKKESAAQIYLVFDAKKTTKIQQAGIRIKKKIEIKDKLLNKFQSIVFQALAQNRKIQLQTIKNKIHFIENKTGKEVLHMINLMRDVIQKQKDCIEQLEQSRQKKS